MSACLSVDHVRDLCKNGRTDQDADWMIDSSGTKEPCIRWGPDLRRGKDNFWELSGH